MTIDASLACRRLGGVAATGEFYAMGVTARSLQHALDSGDLVRPRRGCYALATLAPEALIALAHGGSLCCAAVLRLERIWMLDPEGKVHVWLGPNGRAHRHPDCGCRVHRDRGGSTGWRVALVQALTQVLGCLGEESFFAALESALRRRLLTSAERHTLWTAVPAVHRWLVDFARHDADSGLESLIRLRLHRLGIEVVTQVKITGVGTVDFVIGDRLIIEADGETHAGEDNRHRDLMRDASAAALGFVTLRFNYAQVVHDWDTVESAIVAALANDIHRSPAGLRREGSVPLA